MIASLDLELIEYLRVLVVWCVVEEEDGVLPPVRVLGGELPDQLGDEAAEHLVVYVCLEHGEVQSSMVINRCDHREPGRDVLRAQ